MRPVSRGGRHFWQGLVSILAAAAVVGAAVAWRVGHLGAFAAPSLPAAAVTALAQDGMTPMSNLPAPNFTLWDQWGRPVSLNSFRGRVVVLTFLDPVCWDQCPLQAADMKAMLTLLPPGERQDVALVAIAANPVVHSEAALQAFDNEVGLSRTPEWFFLTAPHVSTLERVWHAYYVTVLVPRDGMVQHSQVYYLIGRHGRVRYVSMPVDTVGLYKGTAELLAAYVQKLLGPMPTPVGSAPAWHEAFWGRLTPPAANLTRVVWVRQGLAGWRVIAREGYVTLQFTTNGGRTWRDVSPPGVSKRGGLLAAFGPGTQAWVLVLPWGYDHTPVSFYTADAGQSWTAPVVWPPGCLSTPVGQPLAAADGRAYFFDRDGLWQEVGGGPWVRVAGLPTGWTTTGPVMVRWSGGVVVEGPDGTMIWRPGGGWSPARNAT